MEVLVSINSLDEAKLVLPAGVKWIDLKDTSHGALSALSPSVSVGIVEYIQQVKKTSHQKVTVSATIGDAFANQQAFVVQLQEKHKLGIDIIKIPYQAMTLFQDLETLGQFFGQVVKPSKVIVVFTPENIFSLNEGLTACLEKLKSVGIYGVMLDTLDKSKHLFASLAHSHIHFFIQSARKNEFFVGLAGGLQIQHIDDLLEMTPDIVGFRSSISVENNRKHAICPNALKLLLGYL